MMAPSMTFHCDVLPKTRNCARSPARLPPTSGAVTCTPGCDRQHREHVVAGRQDRRQLLGERRGHHRVRDVDDWRVADDGDRFRHRRDFHHDVEGGGEAGRQLNALADDGARTPEARTSPCRCPAAAARTGRRPARRVTDAPDAHHRRARQGEIDARKHRARRIGHPPGNDAVLSPTRHGQEQHQRRGNGDSPEVAHRCPFNKPADDEDELTDGNLWLTRAGGKQ